LEERFASQIKKLGKCKASKACLYIKKLADVDLAVLREMIEANLEHVDSLSKSATAKKTKKK
jgi:hypothetical protein